MAVVRHNHKGLSRMLVAHMLVWSLPAQGMGVHAVGKTIGWLESGVAALGGHQVRGLLWGDLKIRRVHHHARREWQRGIGQLQPHA